MQTLSHYNHHIAPPEGQKNNHQRFTLNSASDDTPRKNRHVSAPSLEVLHPSVEHTTTLSSWGPFLVAGHVPTSRSLGINPTGKGPSAATPDASPQTRPATETPTCGSQLKQMPATPKNNGQIEQTKNYQGFALTREPYHFPATNTASSPQKDKKNARDSP